MILSSELLFSDDQAVTATANSTNLIDLGATGTVLNAPNNLVRDIGQGNPVPILIQVTEDFETLDSLQVIVQVDGDDGFGSARDVLETDTVAQADLVAGFKFPIIRVPITTDERYVRLRYVVAGSNATAGKITAGITAAVQQGVAPGVKGLGGT